MDTSFDPEKAIRGFLDYCEREGIDHKALIDAASKHFRSNTINPPRPLTQEDFDAWVRDELEFSKEDCPKCKELRAELLELYWMGFFRSVDMTDGWRLPTVSDQKDACYELLQRGLVEEHPDMGWFRVVDHDDPAREKEE